MEVVLITIRKTYKRLLSTLRCHSCVRSSNQITMKSIIILAVALVAVVVAAPPPAPLGDSKQVDILENNFEKQPDNTYLYNFKAANGIAVQESGQLKEVVGEDNKSQNVIVVKGSYTYPDKDGKPISVTYVADETGFHPEGESIPKVAQSS